MPTSLQYKSSFLLSQHTFLLYPVGESIAILQRTNFASKSPIFPSLFCLSHEIQIQKPIVCAKKNKNRSGSRKLTRFILQSLPIIASNLKILPQPLDLVVAELGGGDGGRGGLGYSKDFGGGVFDWWSRRKMKNWGFFMVFVGGCCLLALYLGIELKNEVFSWLVLCLGLLSGIVLVKGYKRKAKDLVLGLFWFGVLVCLGLRREELQKWVKRFGVSSPVVEMVRSRRRSRNGRTRRAF